MRHSNGQSLVEFALLAPVLLLLLLITVDVGRLFSDWVVLTNAAREGAYLASANYYLGTPNQAVTDAVVREGSAVGVQQAEIQIIYLSRGVAPVVAPVVPPIDVTVTITHGFRPFSPFVGSIMGSVLSVTASSSFRVPLQPTPPPAVPPTKATPVPTPTPAPMAARLVVSGPPSATAGSPQSFTVVVQDAVGNTVTGYAGAIHFTGTDVQATLPVDYRFVAADKGSHTFTNAVTLKTAGVQTVAAADTVTSSINDTSDPVSVSPAAPNRLAFSQSTDTVATVAMSPPLTATVQDSYANAVTTSSAAITIALDANPNAGTLSGTLSVNAVNGVATFSDLSVDKAGTNYTLAASSAGLLGATSSRFTIVAGPTTQLAFTAQPSVGTAGTSLSPAVQVTALDAGGNTAASYVGTVHFTSSDAQADLPADYTFGTGDGGVHTFTNAVTLNTAGPQTVTAIDTVTSTITDTTDQISVNAAAVSQLSVVASTDSIIAGLPVSVTVTAQDQYGTPTDGNTVTSYVGTVRFTSTDPQAGLPANYTFVAGDNGTHTFSNAVTLKTSGLQTIAAADTVTGSVNGSTQPITVGAAAVNQLSLVESTGTTTAGSSMGFTVVAQDAFGNTVTSYVGSIQFTSSDPQASLPPNYTFVAGDAGRHTFSNAVILKTTGSRTLSATDTANGSIGDISGPITVIAAAAKSLVFSAQPSDSLAGSLMTPAVIAQVQDAFGNVVTSSSVPVALVLDPTPGGGTLGGSTSANASSGLATFANLSIDQASSGYTLTASSSGLTSRTSTSFTISAGPPATLVFSSQPGDADARASLTPAVRVTIQDSMGNTVVSSSATVTLAIGANPGGGRLVGSTSVGASNGEASFVDLSINQAGAGYTLTAASSGVPSATSGQFDITPGAAYQLAVSGPSSAVAGTAQTVTVASTDLSGNTVTDYLGTVHFTSTDVQAVLPANYTFVASDNGSHTFSSAVFLKTAGSKTVSATDTVSGSITGTTAPILVSAAAASRLLVVGSTRALTAGALMSVTLTAQDPYSNTFGGYVGTVHFTSTDVQAVLPANYTFVAGDNGSHTFGNAVSLKTVGSKTVSATDTISSSITGTTAPILVSAAAASRLLVVGSTGTLTAGTLMDVTVTAQDPYSNTFSGYLGTVHFTSTDAQAVLSANYTFAAGDNGSHIFSNAVSLKTVGSKTVSATDTITGSITGTTAPILVSAAAASRLLVVGSTGTLTAGALMSVTVTAQDPYSNTFSGYLGTVHFTSTDAQAALPADYLFVASDNGSHIFSNAVSLKTVGSKTISATDTVTSSIAGTTASVTVSPGAAKNLVFSQQPSNTAAGSPISPALLVQVQDSFGNLVTSSTASIKMVIGTNPGAGTLSGTTAVKVVSGVASFTNLSINKSGTGYTFKPTSSGLTTPTSSSFNLTPGAASRLTITVQPRSAAAGVSISPSVQIAVRDGNANTVTTSTASMTIGIAANPGGGTLSGTLTVSAVNGVATFSGLSINRPGTNYTLSASSSGLIGVTSTVFSITFGAANRLAFITQPTSATAGVSINPPVQVIVQDSQGNTVTNSTLSIAMAIGTNPGGGTLSGTTSIAAVSGVATFSNLSINRTGTGYVLTASRSGLTSASSAAFTISAAAASRLAFTVQPSTTIAGATISPSVVVAVQDAFGNTVPSSTAAITTAIGTNPGGGTLSGTLSVGAVNGAATLGDLSINRTGAGYTLTASSSGLSTATTLAFTVTAGAANQLAFTTQPASAVAGAGISPSIQVTVLDGLGNTVTSSAASISMTIGTNPGGGTLSGTAIVNAVNGVATFGGLSINRTATGYALTTSSGVLAGATSTTFTITPGAANRLAFTTQPSTAAVGTSISPSVQVTVQDGLGNTVTSSAASISMTIGTNPGSGTLSGTLTVSAVNGVATLSNLSINRPGSGYTVKAASSGLATITSTTFNVT